LQAAIADFNDGMPIRTTAWDNGIPASSLRGHIFGTIFQRRMKKKEYL